jgi:hypothetical protein
MVTFLTLLLGLVIGERQIELAVDDRVASVEVRLDRTLVGMVDGPPWSITCNLGEKLAPHPLEAVARDGEGREIDRAVQRVNLPREPAEVSLALRGGGSSQGSPSFEAGEPEPLFDVRVNSYDPAWGAYFYSVSPDGQRFLINHLESTEDPVLNVVVNWQRAFGVSR